MVPIPEQESYSTGLPVPTQIDTDEGLHEMLILHCRGPAFLVLTKMGVETVETIRNSVLYCINR
jgi:hypothetical protein